MQKILILSRETTHIITFFDYDDLYTQQMRHLPYGLGIAIPCFLILFIGYGVYFFSLPRLDEVHTTLWLVGYAMVWLSYLIAIFKSPGHPKPRKLEKLDLWCKKCNATKPERSHHCKQCGKCVLKMDHHCPWTANCVGHANLPHFFRFVFWVVAETSYSLYIEIQFFREMWGEPAYLYSRSQMTFIIVTMIVTFFITVTVGALLFRVLYNTANGQTQIEAWEQDRVDTMARRKLGPHVEFPFDVSLYSNLYTGLGPIYLWLWPFSTSPGAGYTYPKLFETEKRWPPNNKLDNEHTRYDFYRPENYISPDGEDLEFFGVDAEVDTKVDKDDIPLAALN